MSHKADNEPMELAVVDDNDRPKLRIQTTVFSEFQDGGAQQHVDHCAAQLKKNLESKKDLVGSCDLEMKVVDYVETSKKARLALDVSGEINGKPFEYRARSRFPKENIDSASGLDSASETAGAYAGCVGGLIISGLVGVLKVFSQPKELDAGKRMDACWRECLNDVNVAIEGFFGKTQFHLSFWNITSKIRVAVFLLGLLAVVVSVFATNPDSGSPDVDGSILDHPVLIGLITFLAYLLLWMFSVLVMPREFFDKHPAGKRAVSFSGMGNYIGLKILCAIVLGLAGLFFLSVLSDGISQKP